MNNSLLEQEMYYTYAVQSVKDKLVESKRETEYRKSLSSLYTDHIYNELKDIICREVKTVLQEEVNKLFDLYIGMVVSIYKEHLESIDRLELSRTRMEVVFKEQIGKLTSTYLKVDNMFMNKLSLSFIYDIILPFLINPQVSDCKIVYVASSCKLNVNYVSDVLEQAIDTHLQQLLKQGKHALISDISSLPLIPLCIDKQSLYEYLYSNKDELLRLVKDFAPDYIHRFITIEG